MRRLWVLGCVLLGIASGAAADEGYGPLIRAGLSEELAIGADLFFSETFEGNGRTCGTCHLASENYTLPADLSGVSEQSPLMVGDPDNLNHVPELELCDLADSNEDCQAIRQNGLILVNADGDNEGPDGARSYSMRSIPHVLSLETSLTAPPNGLDEATGWSGDGAPGDGTLREFAIGAVRQHFTLDTDRLLGDFREPDGPELDAMETFQRQLGRRNDINLTAVQFLDDNATDGVVIFNEEGGRCSRCHVNAGALSGAVNANFNTHIEENRIAGCQNLPSGDPGKCAEESADLVPGANHDGGFGVASLLGDDRWGDGTFNTTPLIEAADTPPFFHDNSRDTLEAAIAFYRSSVFLDSPACDGVNLCGLEGTGALGPEIRLGAMLRILNAGLNISMAVQRLHAAFELRATQPATDPSVIKVLELAGEELADAKAAIGRNKFVGVPVFDNTGNHILEARAELDQAAATLDGYIANGASGLQLAVLITSLVATTNDHLSDSFYDETSATCAARGVAVNPGSYHDCRWIYDLGEANVLFDNAGVTPSIVESETEITWTPTLDGNAILTMRWVTAEWTNPLFAETVLEDLSRNPDFDPITFTGSVTELADGSYERSYSHTIPCRPNAKYRMTATARVGGVTETDSDTVKAPRYCIGF